MRSDADQNPAMQMAIEQHEKKSTVISHHIQRKCVYTRLCLFYIKIESNATVESFFGCRFAQKLNLPQIQASIN